MKKYTNSLVLGLIMTLLATTITPGKVANAKTRSLKEPVTITYTDEENLQKYGFPPSSETSESGIGIFALPNDNPDSKLIVAPVYRTYTNQELRVVADIFTSYIVSKIPTAITKNVLFNYYISKLTKISQSIPVTYVGSWVYETHDYNRQLHIRYATVVHYSDATYSKPISVELIQVDYYSIDYHK
ncbi:MULTISPECIES: hypothetical protein [Clostridium]|uniref:Uncharacterized protein n=2 Tax=root TaxID=1 RepID=R9C5D0_9CLOT|nr:MULTISPECIES: hypothetical protein [Clostridium]EOR24488.1 hypothetical protein A500_12844 [Clostridium sartagoforme AAU1]KLE14778.1 hypothetical protein AAT22_14945 [Clostridium sp. C8]